ncbi:MMPL family transporter [Kribbella sp. NPDC020789]
MPASAAQAYAQFLVRRRGWVAALGLLLTIVVLAIGSGALGALSLSPIVAPDSESDRASQILEAQFRTGPPNLVFLVDAGDRSVDDPEVRAAGVRLAGELAGSAGVGEVGSYWSRGNSPALRSTDWHQALVLVRVPGDVNEARPIVGALAKNLSGQRWGVGIRAGGQDEVFRQIGAQARTDFVRAEVIIIPAVLLLLVVIYRRVRLALVTLGVGLFAIGGALTGLRLIAAFTEVSTFAANLALVMGVALGVDYCLLVIARFREVLASGADAGHAVETAVRTAGRTVFFSGLTVATSLLALLLFPLPFLRSFGYAGVLVVFAALVGSLVILPAVLALLGQRAAGRTTGRLAGRGWWFRSAHLVMRRPVLAGGVALAFVLLLSAPALGLRFGLPDARILPSEASSRITADEIRNNFGQEESDAFYLVAPRAGAGLAPYAAQLSQIDGIAQVDSAAGVFVDGRRVIPPGDDRFTRAGGTYLTATPTQELLEGDLGGLAQRLRAVPPPYPVLIGGTPAEMLDWRASLTARIPLVLGLILLLSFAVLWLATGSVLLPVKATVLNLLSLAVMFGVMVWVFQDGHLSGLLGFTPTGVLEASMPMLMFCIVYGLSMDYEVFIVSRIREEYLRIGDTASAVAIGLQRTAPLVTTAATVLALSFAVYATGGVVYLKMIGVGMAVAVLVDATLIRGVLLPAFMKLAGRANWWAPAITRRSGRGLPQELVVVREKLGRGQ